jgi:hypothetical protein
MFLKLKKIFHGGAVDRKLCFTENDANVQGGRLCDGALFGGVIVCGGEAA